MLVEDDSDFQLLVRMILNGGAAGEIDVMTAENGQAAIEAIGQHKPDLVILDLMLPDMNGWEVFIAMRSEARSAGIPVIILSSQGNRYDRSFGLRVARVHDYFLKPCLPSQLQASVAAALQN